MKEFSYAIEDIQEIFPAIYEVLDEKKAMGARHVLVMIYGRLEAQQLLERVRHAVEQRMPHACVAGAISTQAIVDGHLTDARVAVSFTLFQSSVPSAWLYDFAETTPEAAGASFAGVFQSEEDVRAVEVIGTGDRLRTEPFFAALAALPEDVEVFGGITESGQPGEGYVFAGDARASHGMLAVIFAGAELHVSVHSSFGWKPLGRPMTITKMKDPFTVLSIDQRPAIEVYQKYLGLGMDEDILMEMLTFPLFFHRGGVTLARHPRSYERDGSVYFAADFREGEQVQIAYGDPQEILDTADMLQVGMAAFRPEAIYFVSCVARSLLLAADTEKELAMSRYAPSAGFYAYGEFMRCDGEIVTSNMTLVTIGMREGAPSDRPVKLPPRVSHVDTRTSIMRHLVNFVQQVIGELEDANERYRRLARHDLLTGLLNRGTTDETLAAMVDEAEEEDAPLAVLMMDIDDFKGINDTCGHTVGDQAIRLVARALQSEVRDGIDAVGRMGGDEFLVILAHMDEREARYVAGRIRKRIANLAALPGGRTVTTSIGLATFMRGDTAQDLYKRADEALYAAKQSGKNAVAAAKRKR